MQGARFPYSLQDRELQTERERDDDDGGRCLAEAAAQYLNRRVCDEAESRSQWQLKT